MNKANIEAQEDLAFDTMDDMLDRASWKSGTLTLKAINTVYFCYDIPKLRSTLSEVAIAAVKKKYRQCDIDVKPVVDNILEEYAHELKKFRIFERTPPHTVKA